MALKSAARLAANLGEHSTIRETKELERVGGVKS